jgi:glycine oxidase
MNLMEDKVTIIGGGVIGLSLGWQLLRKGAEVEIFERDLSGRGAGWVAAGMLTPQAELGFEEIELFNFMRKSLELYPRFLNELNEDSGIDVKIDNCGSLFAGFERDDMRRLRRIYDFREKINLPAKWLTGSEAKELEPMLSPKCTCGLWMPDDAQIENRELLKALLRAFRNKGGQIHEIANVFSIKIENSKIKGITVNDKYVEVSNLVVAAGAWSKQIQGIPENMLPPVRPVKGQIMSLSMEGDNRVKHAIRGRDVYLVPKADGRLIVGASNEEMGFDTNPTAGEIYRLLERAWETVPGIYEYPIQEIQVGLRPGSRDHEPIICDSEIEGLYFATGHYRSGILLTPVTAYELSDWIITGKKSELLAPYQLSRFYRETV